MDRDEARDNDIQSSTPLWVKMSGLIVLVVVIAFVVLLIIGSGHGPARHAAGLLPLVA